MKLFLASLLLVVAVHGFGGEKEKYMLKKWTVHKAMESCFGAENVKMYMVKKKQAVAKCMRQEAPELDLPMFQRPYRAVGALVNSAYSNKGAYSQSYGMGHHRPAHDNDDKFNDIMLKYFIEKAVRDVMADGGDDNDSEQYYRRKPSFGGRQKRDHHDSKKYEIGEKLNNKLMELKEHLNNEISNCTCVLKECGVLNSQGEFNDVESIINKMDDMNFPDPWLKDHCEKDVRICHEMANNIPQEALDECIYGPELAKAKCFKTCTKMRKLKTCMRFDIKQQLEANFAPLPELIDDTKMEEDHLLPLVYKLLHGQEKMF